MFVIRKGQRPVEVRIGFEPFQVSMLAAFGLWGGTMLVALSSVQGATSSAFPQWGAYLFFGAMLAGTATTLVGVAYEIFRHDFFGLYVERAGLTMLMGLSLSYSIWVQYVVGVRGLPFAYLMGGVLLGCTWRCLLIRADIRSVKST